MKIQVKDLIPDRYYCCHKNSVTFYFKYKFHDEDNIYSFGYEMSKNHFDKLYYYDSISGYIESKIINNNEEHIFCAIAYLDSCEKSYEIDYKDILEYLPENNPDKICYLRKQKINHLLSN